MGTPTFLANCRQTPNNWHQTVEMTMAAVSLGSRSTEKHNNDRKQAKLHVIQYLVAPQGGAVSSYPMLACVIIRIKARRSKRSKCSSSVSCAVDFQDQLQCRCIPPRSRSSGSSSEPPPVCVDQQSHSASDGLKKHAARKPLYTYSSNGTVLCIDSQ